jgi:hypothetical protein
MAAPGLQVTVTDPSDLDEAWFQVVVVEKWRWGTKPVPELRYASGP